MSRFLFLLVAALVFVNFSIASGQEVYLSIANHYPSGWEEAPRGATNYEAWSFWLSANNGDVVLKGSLVITVVGTVTGSDISMFKLEIGGQEVGRQGFLGRSGPNYSRLYFTLPDSILIPQEKVGESNTRRAVLSMDVADSAKGSMRFIIYQMHISAYDSMGNLIKVNPGEHNWFLASSHSATSFTLIQGTSKDELPKAGNLVVESQDSNQALDIVEGSRAIKILRGNYTAEGEDILLPYLDLYVSAKINPSSIRVLRYDYPLQSTPIERIPEVIQLEPNVYRLLNMGARFYEWIYAGSSPTYEIVIDFEDSNGTHLPAGTVVKSQIMAMMAIGLESYLPIYAPAVVGKTYYVVSDTTIISPPDSTSPPPPPIFNFDGVIGPEELFRKPFDLKTESPAQGFEFTFFCPGADSLAWSESAEFITQTRLEGDTLRVVGVSAQGGYKLGELVVKYSAPGTYVIPWSVVLYLTGGTKVGQEGTLRVKVLAEPAVSVEPPVISVADSARVKLSPALGVLFGFGYDGIGGELRNGWFVPSLESVSLYDWQGKTEARTTLRFATSSGVFTADLTLKALLGDVNIDNGMNVIDVVMMLRFILGEVYFVSYQQVVADFDQSGSFDLWDVIALVRHILGLPQETQETTPPVMTKAVAADLVGLISRLEALPGVDQRAVVELKRLLGLETGEADVSVPTKFSLEQNFPNPFNPATTIKFALPKTGHVVLKIYNVLGQEVVTLINADLPAGFHEAVWNAAGVSSGTFFYRLTDQGGVSQTRKMALLK